MVAVGTVEDSVSGLRELNEGVDERDDRTVIHLAKIEVNKDEGKHHVLRVQVVQIGVDRCAADGLEDFRSRFRGIQDDGASIVMIASDCPLRRISELVFIGPYDFAHGQSGDGRKGQDVGQNG